MSKTNNQTDNIESLSFKISDFEGPLDLMLEMFKSNKMEITEISIEIIINQYIDYIALLEEHKYEVALEYLEMAAELILYKSRKVLKEEEEIEEEIEEVITPQELVERILEYKKYKEVSKEFKSLEEERSNYLTREESDLSKFYKPKLEKIDYEYFLQVVSKTYQNIFDNQDDSREMDIRKELDVEKYLEELEKLEEINFNNYIENLNKVELITFFLAFLELVKKENVTFYELENNIIIKIN